MSQHTDRDRGRSDPIDERITFRAPDHLIEEIDTYVESTDGVTNRSQAIRELLDEATDSSSRQQSSQHEP